MGFLKENSDYNYIINKRLYPDQAYNIVVFKFILKKFNQPQ